MLSLRNRVLLPSLGAGIIFVALIIGLQADYTYAQNPEKSKNDPFYTWSDIFGQVMKHVHNEYVTEVDDSALITTAIQKALETLDPHTVFFQPEEYNDLMIQSDGEFGGLGIQISVRDNILTVITPISGTPASRAGLRSGDKILRIEGKSTKGITVDEAVKFLRGKPGTMVKITIGRTGTSELLEYEITRAIVDIKSVPYAGMLNDSIGYIRLNTFSAKAATEVGAKVDSLLALGMKGLIFDLRYNPGGLLDQATEVSELFLGQDRLVVYTEGRSQKQKVQLYSKKKPLLPLSMPLVVLVNGGSASASEIVAGAIQDWDRGVIVGDTTFGKGSVQSVFPVDRLTNSHMKMTTAYYYTPSGRCINKPENYKMLSAEESAWGLDDDTTQDSTTKSSQKDTTKYFTKAGRVVYGGGGIIPDTIVEIVQPSFVVQQLLNKDLFFSFTDTYMPKLKAKGAKIDASFKVSSNMLADFYGFVDTSKVELLTAAEKRYKEFKVLAGFEADTSIDSATLAYLRNEWTPEERESVQSMIKNLEEALRKNNKRMVKAHEAEIIRYLTESSIAYELGQDDASLHKSRITHDEQVTAALKLIMQPKTYAKKLKK